MRDKIGQIARYFRANQYTFQICNVWAKLSIAAFERQQRTVRVLGMPRDRNNGQAGLRVHGFLGLNENVCILHRLLNHVKDEPHFS